MSQIAPLPQEQGEEQLDIKNDEELKNRSTAVRVLSAIQFYFSQGFKEIKLRTCSFIWGFLSITLVCMVTSIVISVSDKLPVIILMLAENSAGEVDLQISPGTWTDRFGVNSTQAREMLEQLGKDYSQMSPRVYTEINAQSVKEPQNEFFGDFYAIDSDQEDHIQIGREWVYGKIPKGSCIITKSFAKQLNVKKGDEISFLFSVANFTSIAADVIDQHAKRSMPLLMELLSAVPMKLTIYEVADSAKNKVDTSDVKFVEYDEWWPYVVENLPSAVRATIPRKNWLELNMRDYSTELIFSYPQPRTDIYLTFDTEPLKRSLVKWASQITYALRFDELDVQMPVASAFENFSMLGMMINMVSMLIIVVLVGISILLIYSLLMISVDTRTFEIGILRMVGLDRFGVTGVLIAQALLYSIPGWILGIVLGYVGNFVVMYILEDASSVPLQKLMPALSIIISTLIAFGISLIASIFPIRQALSQNLHDSIDVTHTKASAIMVTIERAEALQKPWGLLLCGIILTGIGMGVYYFMPLAMLSMNMMMLSILFFILLTMILISLIMLALNVEFLLERLLAAAFLFWEARAVKTLAVKNLGAHRMRNRKTTLLFSISLAFIVFVNVMVSIALSMIDTMIYMERGCNLDVVGQPSGRGGDGGSNSMVMSLLGMSSTRFNPTIKYIQDPKAVQDILMKNDKFKDKVYSISWATHKLETVYPSPSRTQVANQGRSHAFYHQIVGVSPNILDGANHHYIQMGLGKKSGDDVIKQLYTRSFEGFSAVLSNGLRREMGADLGQVFMVNIVPFSSVTGGGGLLDSMAEFLGNSLSRRNLTTSSYMKALPFINMPSATLSLSDDPDVPVSIPTYLQLLPDGYGDYENIKFEHMFVKLKKGVSREEEVEMYDELRSYRQDPDDDQSRLGVWSYQNVLKFISQAGNIIDIAFMAITILVMILCFFSLMSSMHTNVMEQQKEIGIMRALGLTAIQLLRVYVEEAFILVITAAFMGLVVGMIVGYMLISQMSSLQGLPVPFFFPWQLALIMIAMAVVTSILSAAQPAFSVMRKSIVTVMKST